MELLRISYRLMIVACLIVVGGVGGSLIGVNRLPETAAAGTSPVPQASRAPYVTRTATDVVTGLAKDPFWIRQRDQAALPGPVFDPRVATGTLGQPIIVRALRPGGESGWLVPVLASDGRPVAAIAVSEDRNGFGLATAMRGWPYATVPAVPESDARKRGMLPGHIVTGTVLLWSDSLGRPADLLSPFWRVTNSGGDSVFVFENGDAVPATTFGVQ